MLYTSRWGPVHVVISDTGVIKDTADALNAVCS